MKNITVRGTFENGHFVPAEGEQMEVPEGVKVIVLMEIFTVEECNREFEEARQELRKKVRELEDKLRMSGV